MHARTLYNIFNTQVHVKAAKALAALVVLSFVSCSSESVIEEIEEIDPTHNDPLSFTCNVQSVAQEQNITRANETPQPLTTGFMVSTYKAYASGSQQSVMEKYNVERKTSGSAWDGTVRPYWDYTKVDGQYEKYWDFSNFPYRFHAIAPYPENPSGYILSDKQLHIAAPYYYQTCHNGLVQTRDASGNITSDPAEPHMIAQVHRAADGKDQDLLASIDKADINTGSTSLNRTVWMPFHHLNSKIRFRVYSLQPWVSANYLYIKDLTINVASDNFRTAATGFDATLSNTGAWNILNPDYGFTGLTQKSATELATTPLFRFDGGKEVPGNDMRECQTPKTAFDLQCKDGFVQLPQQDVKLTVSFNLYDKDDQLKKAFTNVPVVIDLDGVYHPTHTWQPGYIYTYYLVIGGLDDKLEITFTATLNEWEDVSGSLSTDLEK